MSSVFNIVDFGAIADGVTNNAAAIQKAIDAATVSGGRVVVPAGEFLSGTITLKSDVELHLEKGAVLISSLKEEDIYEFAKLFDDDNLVTGWDGGCFLFACHAKNVTISGEGTIYGQGEKVFFDGDCDNGFHECPKCVTAFRPRTSFLEDVENLTIKDITIKDAAFWTLHMAGCKHVRINGIKILNDLRGANNDGIDPDCCKDVIITDCIVKGGDDSIVIKSTKPMTAKYGGSENIVIANCVLTARSCAVKIGTETHGYIRNILFHDCVVEDSSRGIGIWVRDGATIEDIHVHDITGNTLRYADGWLPNGEPGPRWWGKGDPIYISSTYRDERKLFPGTIKNITIDHIYMKSETTILIAGEPDSVISNVRLSDINLTMVKQGTQPHDTFDEQPSMYGNYKHDMTAVYLRNVKNVDVSGVITLEGDYKDMKTPVLCDRCEDTAVNVDFR